MCFLLSRTPWIRRSSPKGGVPTHFCMRDGGRDPAPTPSTPTTPLGGVHHIPRHYLEPHCAARIAAAGRNCRGPSFFCPTAGADLAPFPCALPAALTGISLLPLVATVDR
jgi:hypothetical protein